MKIDTLAALIQISTRASKVDVAALPPPAQQIEPGDTPVGTMTETMRRLYGVWLEIAGEVEARKLRAESIKSQIETILGLEGESADYARIIAGAKNPLLDPLVREFNEMGTLLQQADSLQEITKGLFWHEVRVAHPVLWSAPTVGIFNDWSIGTRAEKKDTEDGMDLGALLAGMEGNRGRARRRPPGGLF